MFGMNGNIKVSAGGVAKYTLLPGFLPRLRGLAGEGLGHVAFFMAQVYRMVRLLPANHPYLLGANIGKFGILHVIAAAANNLIISWKNIDQIIVFIALLFGMIILGLQFVLLLVSIMIPAAFALPTDFPGFFVTAAPENDLAFIMLDRVFGVPDFFNSCVAINTPCLGSPIADGAFPYPYHAGLHMMFQLYSTGLLVIAALILCYFIVAVIAETAKDGTPFGRRFNQVWAPIRLVVAFGLLVPVSLGLNSAQYIVLYAAKWGSGFATNGWILFNNGLGQAYLGEAENMIAQPKIPQVDKLLQFFTVAQVCKFSEMRMYGKTPHAYLVRDNTLNPNFMDLGGEPIPGDPPTSAALTVPAWDDVKAFFENKTVIMRFGERNEDNYGQHKGWVNPDCGEISFQLTDLEEPGAQYILEQYFQFLLSLWVDANIEEAAIQIMSNYSVPNSVPGPMPGQDFKNTVTENYSTGVQTIVDAGIDEQIATGTFLDAALLDLGWGGAGIWYNMIAQKNGAVTSAALNMPRPSLWTAKMEHMRRELQKKNADLAGLDMFNPVFADGQQYQPLRPGDTNIMQAEYFAFHFWESENQGRGLSERNGTTNNPILDTINFLFGTEGLFNIRENADVHPLAQLSAVGKSLVESAIRNLAIAGVASIPGLFPGELSRIASSFLVSFAMIGLTAGFVLFYVIPFLPFIYFFFAVAKWVKGIFEAMIGVPLWALAHIRIDGEGLPGDAASSGYFLIFEIFLRPLLIVFGLLGSVLVFGAMVKVLNEIWDIVTYNLAGFDTNTAAAAAGWEYYRGRIDQFFYLIIYTVIVYMMGVASFKMVDQVPNSIMRWLGVSVQSFGDRADDPTEGLVQTVAIGGGGVLRQLGGAAGQGKEAIKKLVS